jgi:hypothetical protein
MYIILVKALHSDGSVPLRWLLLTFLQVGGHTT